MQRLMILDLGKELPSVHLETHSSGDIGFVVATMDIKVAGKTVPYTSPGSSAQEAVHNLGKILEAVGNTLDSLGGLLPYEIRKAGEPPRQAILPLRFYDLSKTLLHLSFQDEEDWDLREDVNAC